MTALPGRLVGRWKFPGQEPCRCPDCASPRGKDRVSKRTVKRREERWWRREGGDCG